MEATSWNGVKNNGQCTPKWYDQTRNIFIPFSLWGDCGFSLLCTAHISKEVYSTSLFSSVPYLDVPYLLAVCTYMQHLLQCSYNVLQHRHSKSITHSICTYWAEHQKPTYIQCHDAHMTANRLDIWNPHKPTPMHIWMNTGTLKTHVNCTQIHAHVNVKRLVIRDLTYIENPHIYECRQAIRYLWPTYTHTHVHRSAHRLDIYRDPQVQYWKSLHMNAHRLLDICDPHTPTPMHVWIAHRMENWDPHATVIHSNQCMCWHRQFSTK